MKHNPFAGLSSPQNLAQVNDKNQNDDKSATSKKNDPRFSATSTTSKSSATKSHEGILDLWPEDEHGTERNKGEYEKDESAQFSGKLLSKPFLLTEGVIFAAPNTQDYFVLKDLNKDAIDWEKTQINRVTMTRLGEQVRVHKTFDYNVIAALIKLQGMPGVPRLVAYYSEPLTNCIRIFFALEEYPSTTPQPSLNLLTMVDQLLSALKAINAQYIELGSIRSDSIRWQGDQIKFIRWDNAKFRGDAFNHQGFICPARDVFDAGKLINDWSLSGQTHEQTRLRPIASAMMNRCSYRQLSLDAALHALVDDNVIELYFRAYGDVDKMTLKEQLKCCDESELNSIVRKLTQGIFAKAPNMTHEEGLKHIGITKYDVKPNYPNVYFSYLEDKYNVITKICSTTLLRDTFGIELFVSQLLSDESRRSPYLVKYHVYKNTTHPKDKYNIMMVFQRYSTSPPEGSKNILKFASLLFAAIEAMHELHLVHSDIAPKNIVWDDDGEPVLIDFGSTYYANIRFLLTSVSRVPYGHEGFMPKEKFRFFATDVYSAGKTIEYFAREWGQWTNQIEEIVNLMTAEHWAARCSLKRATKLFSDCSAN